MKKTALCLLLAAACDAHVDSEVVVPSGAAGRAFADTWCAPQNIHVFADRGDVVELNVCGHRRIYQCHWTLGRHHWQCNWELAKPPPKLFRNEPGCTDEQLAELRDGGVSEEAVAYACAP